LIQGSNYPILQSEAERPQEMEWLPFSSARRSPASL
jgi:hypothetical protein